MASGFDLNFPPRANLPVTGVGSSSLNALAKDKRNQALLCVIFFLCYVSRSCHSRWKASFQKVIVSGNPPSVFFLVSTQKETASHRENTNVKSEVARLLEKGGIDRSGAHIWHTLVISVLKAEHLCGMTFPGETDKPIFTSNRTLITIPRNIST